MRPMKFLSDFKQRKIGQWTLTYLAGAWLMMQLMDVLAGHWGFTDAIGRIFDLALVLGLFVTLILAWYHGEKGRQRVSGPELLIIAGILGIGALGFSLLDLGEQTASITDAPDVRVSRGTLDDSRPSVAVLPFANASAGGGEEAAFFAAGIHEDILSQISKIEAIKVISRTSVMTYREGVPNVRAIAEALGVRTVLEGGVQVAGDRVRINLQLIDAATDEHLWAESYNEALTTDSIFTIQSDVAHKVAAALKATLTPAERARIDKRGTDNLEAYQLYLKGRSYWNRRTAADMWQAVEYFNAAIEVDDAYATAYAGLADTYAHLGLAAYSGAPADEVLPLAKNALLRALELDNEIAEAYAALGFIRSWYDRDWAGAELAFERAIELNPNYAPTYQWHSHYLVAQGKYDEAVTQIRKALELDPRSLITYMVASSVLDVAGRPDDAIAKVKYALEINPDFWFAHLTLAHRYAGNSMFSEALAAAENAVNISDRAVSAVAEQGFIYGRSGDSVRATELLHELERRSATEYVSPHNFALLRIGLGQDEQALDDLERAVPNLDLLYLNIAYEYDTLRSYPRFTAIVQQMNLDADSLQ
jgi:TolB-like protein/lipopolysaccharide biosynthesis regulator YciM